jgi:hypothetical protein
MISLLKNKLLKDWFLEAKNFIPCNELNIATIGSQPFLEDDFDNYLRANEIEPQPITPNTDVLIVGHEDWEDWEEEIKELLDERDGKSLRVYSQEMFLAEWTTGQDPFEDEEVAEAFAEGHPALEFLKTCWVDWVTTEVSRAEQGGNLLMDSPETSVLKELGYTVGKTKGLHFSARRKILEKAFESDLPDILSKEYIKYCSRHFPHYLPQWGESKSQQRLVKMRDFISANCKQQKRRGNEKAASDYEEDLEWLDMCCRTGRFKFRLQKARVG